jgi:hypothetical protein
MTKLIRKTNNKLAKKERGQVLILVALAIVGIVAVIGLTLDVGIMFIEDARLRRAVDAAALASALQYRSGIPTTQLQVAATEFLLVNGVGLDLDPAHPSVIITTCTDDPLMCTDPTTNKFIWRKLIHVRVSARVRLAFLPVIGINSVPITAEATGESASLDLVLVIDTSESMTAGYQPGDPNYDPVYPKALFDPTTCNDQTKVNAIGYPDSDGLPGECHPFAEVKQAAANFIKGDYLFFPYDRVSIVSFNKNATTRMNFDENCPTSACTTEDADAIRDHITDVINKLKVYDANDYNDDGSLLNDNYCPHGQPCRPYCEPAQLPYCDSMHPQNYRNPADDPLAVFSGKLNCGDPYHYPIFTAPDHPVDDPSLCQTTNIADGLWKAGNAFQVDQKPSSLWVVVLLTDGAANAGTLTTGETTCPSSTWGPYRTVNGVYANNVVCRDLDPNSRHCIPGPSLLTCMSNGNGNTLPHVGGQALELEYDADDSARDWADYLGKNLGAVIYSIGIGPLVHSNNYAGERFLQYAAEFAGNGQYYNAPDASQLGEIFKKIGDKIATRLSQ